MFQTFFKLIWSFLYTIRWILAILLGIGLPFFIYLTFFAKKPVFSAVNDVQLGMQTVRSIEQDPTKYPILDPGEYPEAYAEIRGMVNRLVASPEIKYRDLFHYQDIRIIDDDHVLNAFCTPGGFIYVYTGLLRFLDHEDHLAGVLGHEIAHAELRHSSLRLQKEYGARRLLEFIILTNPVSMKDVINAAILKDLLGLRYGRKQEAQADEYSVRYLASAGYACDGAAGFFTKLLDEGKEARIPEFLSSHPASRERVRDIRRLAAELGCSTALRPPDRWSQFIATLPAPRATTPVDSRTRKKAKSATSG